MTGSFRKLLQWPSQRESGTLAKVKVTATPATGEPQSLVQYAYQPPSVEVLTYDEDGNLASDARWIYTWDAENQLIKMQDKLSTVSLTFDYDAYGRRVRKQVFKGQQWDSTTLFLYEGWNLVAELRKTAGDTADSAPRLHRSYVWGVDLSETEGGAGGVGGLLLMGYHWGESGQMLVYSVGSDANGNVGSLTLTLWLQQAGFVKQGGTEYDPFGRVVGTTLPTGFCNIGFSSKYTDPETGLSYYGHRYYSPEMGRWLSRDPIAEKGGLNLYGMVGNDAVNRWDLLGRQLGGDANWGGGSNSWGIDGPPVAPGLLDSILNDPDTFKPPAEQRRDGAWAGIWTCTANSNAGGHTIRPSSAHSGRDFTCFYTCTGKPDTEEFGSPDQINTLVNQTETGTECNRCKSKVKVRFSFREDPYDPKNPSADNAPVYEFKESVLE